ncbi:MAG: hypothetical protein OXB93_00930 [Cytophagales bacterium]|nr:hypothetical protein [Cytophagales bacterium]
MGVLFSDADDRFKIYSFEVKIRINSINDFRRYYEQAVTNSSWAHIGYLVAAQINISEGDIAKELDGSDTRQPHVGVLQINEDGSIDILSDVEPKERIKKESWERMSNFITRGKDESFREFVKGIGVALKHGDTLFFDRAIGKGKTPKRDDIKEKIAEVHKEVISASQKLR